MRNVLRRPQRPWMITALGLLVLVQSLALLYLGIVNILTVEIQETSGGLAIRQPHKLLSGVLIWLAGLALLSAFNLLRQRRGAWLSAMLLQGLTLLTGLVLHFRDHEIYAYAMLVYSTFMVLYLNYAQRQLEMPLEKA